MLCKITSIVVQSIVSEDIICSNHSRKKFKPAIAGGFEGIGLSFQLKDIDRGLVSETLSDEDIFLLEEIITLKDCGFSQNQIEQMMGNRYQQAITVFSEALREIED